MFYAWYCIHLSSCITSICLDEIYLFINILTWINSRPERSDNKWDLNCCQEQLKEVKEFSRPALTKTVQPLWNWAKESKASISSEEFLKALASSRDFPSFQGADHGFGALAELCLPLQMSGFPPFCQRSPSFVSVVGFDVHESLQWFSGGVQSRHTSVDVGIETKALMVIILCQWV